MVCQQRSDSETAGRVPVPGAAGWAPPGRSELVSLGPVPPFEMGIATHVRTGVRLQGWQETHRTCEF